MKLQQFVNTLNTQIDQLAGKNAVLAASNRLEPHLREFITSMGVDRHKAELENVIAQNMQNLENMANQMEQQYNSNLAKINSQRNAFNNVKNIAESQLTDIKNAESKNLEFSTKIKEVNAQQQQLIIEKATISESKANLINNMNIKQVSFVLQKAIAADKNDVVKSLIDKNLDINFQNNEQETLLHIVLKSVNSSNDTNKKEIFQKLINHADINVNLADEDGNSALSICLKKDDAALVNELSSTLINKNASAESVILKAIKDQDISSLQKITQLMPSSVNNKDTTNKTISEIELYVLENYMKQNNLKIVENIFKIHASLLDQTIEDQSISDFALQHSSQEMSVLIHDLTENYHINLAGQNQ